MRNVLLYSRRVIDVMIDGLRASPFISPPMSLVYFKVTHLDYAVLDTTATSEADPNGIDAYVTATMGELGCYVDPATTKMIQVGVEHSLVPSNVNYYLDVCESRFPTISGSLRVLITTRPNSQSIWSSTIFPERERRRWHAVH